MSAKAKGEDMDSLKNKRFRTIIFALLNGSDNIELCQSLADVLQKKGFTIVFAIDQTTAKLIDKTSGYVEEVFDIQPLHEFSEESLNGLNGSAIDKIKNVGLKVMTEKFEFVRKCEEFNQKLIEKIRPELIIIESLICSPALTNSGIPWVWLNFSGPNLCRNDNRIPPGWSGLSIQKPNDFKAFKMQWNQIFAELKNRINNWCLSKDCPDLPLTIFHPHSPYLNFYVYPKELDYKLSNTWELKNWLQINCLLKRNTSRKFVIPESLRSKPGKLIYLSMGPFASLVLMKRLTTRLGESTNKFIVSKGQFHNQYELPDNMWGTEDIPLNEVIERVDLVITCGDNNTITQCFLNAKPVIVLPLFGDQLDNRSRLKECGFGWGLDPFTCNKETLICMIESTLEDIGQTRRLVNIASSMDCIDSSKQMANEIEKILNPSKDSSQSKQSHVWQNQTLNHILGEAQT